jgi:hypothetical protein
MALEKIVNIEGLEGAYDNVSLADNVNPGATQIKFDVESEEMPALTNSPENVGGGVVRKNFVWVHKIMNLGHSKVSRRIRDVVEYDKEAKKWKVLRLAPGKYADGTPVSDIARYPNEWNLFARNKRDDIIGTPISIMFPADPSRAEAYKYRYIHTVEQLANCTDGDLEGLGLGAGEDRERARVRVRREKEAAPARALEAMLAEKDRRIASLESQMKQLLDQVIPQLAAQEAPVTGAEAPAKRGRKKKEEVEGEHVTQP